MASCSFENINLFVIQGKNGRLILVANIDITSWRILLFSKRGGDGVKRVNGGNRNFKASYKFHLVRVHENLMQHPSYNKSIINSQIS